jgi:hypothetical protein
MSRGVFTRGVLTAMNAGVLTDRHDAISHGMSAQRHQNGLDRS